MVDLCRHIKADGHRCGTPAVHGTFFCYHHSQRKTAIKKAKVRSSKPIPTTPSAASSSRLKETKSPRLCRCLKREKPSTTARNAPAANAPDYTATPRPNATITTAGAASATNRVPSPAQTTPAQNPPNPLAPHHSAGRWGLHRQVFVDGAGSCRGPHRQVVARWGEKQSPEQAGPEQSKGGTGQVRWERFLEMHSERALATAMRTPTTP